MDFSETTRIILSLHHWAALGAAGLFLGESALLAIAVPALRNRKVTQQD